ncbi:polyisoprenoid-binding protein YceI [Pseudoduganella lurida]|uniref:Polyisoprenoid-binding protein YceI n=2 Tax=Pseudoduganella lurida TaxID=1036180 RepID=A0A562QXJ5_9BURK|nr:polyisoprenoid-binding protein YceI [Pseudoduganella lurida]
MKRTALTTALITTLLAAAGLASATTYNIDPSHTYPSFEADHKGMSLWRGKFNSSKGTITLDRAAKTGSLDIEIDINSIDFGHDGMNGHAKKADIFDAEKFPTATYKSKSFRFEGDRLVGVDGELTLHGVTKPVQLKVDRFKCEQNARLKREVCGANATADFNRADFGITFGLPAFAPEVKLAIQVEAIATE